MNVTKLARRRGIVLVELETLATHGFGLVEAVQLSIASTDIFFFDCMSRTASISWLTN